MTPRGDEEEEGHRRRRATELGIAAGYAMRITVFKPICKVMDDKL